MKIHIVQKGETLGKISEKYNVDRKTLREVNSQVKDSESILSGTKIKIPTKRISLQPRKRKSSSGKKSRMKKPTEDSEAYSWNDLEESAEDSRPEFTTEENETEGVENEVENEFERGPAIENDESSDYSLESSSYTRDEESMESIESEEMMNPMTMPPISPMSGFYMPNANIPNVNMPQPSMPMHYPMHYPMPNMFPGPFMMPNGPHPYMGQMSPPMPPQMVMPMYQPPGANPWMMWDEEDSFDWDREEDS